MPACIQKPEGLPPITDVVLDKVGALVPAPTPTSMVSLDAKLLIQSLMSDPLDGAAGAPLIGTQLLVHTSLHHV